MLEVNIPGRESLALGYLVLDMNGTLTTDGRLLPGVAERITILKSHLEIYLLTADTFGTARNVADELGIQVKVVSPVDGGSDKRAVVASLGSRQVAAIGNGFNDVQMLREAALGIAVIGDEGCCARALEAADVVVGNIVNALDLLIQPKRLIATLRA